MSLPHPKVWGRLFEIDPEAVLLRMRQEIDTAQLSPALTGITWDELSTCLLVYVSLDARKRWTKDRKLIERALKASRKVARLCQTGNFDEAAEAGKSQRQLEWRLYWGDADATPGFLSESQFEVKYHKEYGCLPPPGLFDNLKVGGLTAAEHYANAKGLSAFEVIAGRMLPAIFEKYCGQRAGYTFDGSKARTNPERYSHPYIDFAEIVLGELGVRVEGPFSNSRDYTRASIAAAWQKAQDSSLKLRRK
jgi:hypothetical protein